MAALDRAVPNFLLEQRNLQIGWVGDLSLARVAEAFLHVTNVISSISRQPLSPRTQLSDLGARLLVARLVLNVAADAFEAAVALIKLNDLKLHNSNNDLIQRLTAEPGHHTFSDAICSPRRMLPSTRSTRRTDPIVRQSARSLSAADRAEDYCSKSLADRCRCRRDRRTLVPDCHTTSYAS